MRSLLAAVAALLLMSPLARAQGGIGLFVGDCGAGASSTDVSDACTSNAGTAFVAFGTCVLPTTVKHDFVRLVGILDIQTGQAVIPDWWRADGCRASAFVLGADAFIGGSCPTLWDVVAPATSSLTALTSPTGPRPDRIRFLLSVDLDPGAAYDLVGDGVTELSVFRLTVLRMLTVGPGACTGCGFGACLVLNEINLQGLNDTPDQYTRLTAPAPGNFIAYNSDAPACPASVPVRGRTWGAVKALYR